ncbi:MAG: lysophospholipase [Cyanobacteria bacterium J06631_6]
MAKYLLFAQHGWADTGNNIGRLASAAADAETKVIVPSLGLIKTFIRLQPLVEQLEKIAAAEIAHHPQAQIKIMGHSMGGLMWLEVLNRNPSWWHRVHSLILLGSPVGGSNIARIIDPFGIGIGTAADLGKNRRLMAEKIAQAIPTLSVASDLGRGTDGLVTVENTKFDYANWQLISNIAHSAMRYRAEMIPVIQAFWADPQLGSPPATNFTARLIKHLRTVPGMTDTDYRDLRRSQVVSRLADHLVLRTWNNPLGVNHVYLCQHQQCLYAGYVGLIHAGRLRKALKNVSRIAV